MPPPDDDDLPPVPRHRLSRSAVVILVVLGLALVGAVLLYSLVEQRGLSLRGPGHLVRLESGEVWAFFVNDGTLVRVTPQSAARLSLHTGRCARMEGALDGEDLALERVECSEGGLQDAVVERMRRLGLRFGYWADGLESKGETLDEVLETVEVYAAMIDPRIEAPQLVALFRPLFPHVLPAARRAGLPPPVFISVPRNDLAVVRLTRTELGELLELKAFVFAGAAPTGGWLVRSLKVSPEGEGDLRRLLLAPREAPWPSRLQESVLILAPPAGQALAPRDG